MSNRRKKPNTSVEKDKKYQSQKNKSGAPTDSELQKPDNENIKNPLLKVTLKLFIFCLIIFSAIYYSDSKGYFNSKESLDYISKGWDAFDHFTKKNNVDILLMGNSHMFANISPKNLSVTLGVNAFALGSPGGGQHDTYYCLVEALKKCKPSLVILETFGIDNSKMHQDVSHLLTHQLNGFTGRNDIFTKIISTPVLFSPEQYGYAWSKTLRNHNYIFNNTEQLKENKALIEKNKKRSKKNPPSLYLGQLVYYTKGMEDSTLKKFNTIVPPVDGNKYSYNKHTEKYTDKIAELCDKNGIELMFFTNPMYPKNIKDYDKWKAKLSILLNKYKKNWLDLQHDFSYKDFTPECFQNSYTSANQHLTHLGALVSTYKLAHFVEKNYSSILPSRKQNIAWHRMFYGQDGYFENYSPSKQDKNNYTAQLNLKENQNLLSEVVISKRNNGRQQFLQIIAKADRKNTNIPFEDIRLFLEIKYRENGIEKNMPVVLHYNKYYKPSTLALYTQNIQLIDIVSVEQARILPLK